MKTPLPKRAMITALIVFLMVTVTGAQAEEVEKDITFIDTLYSVTMNKASETWCCGFNGIIYYSGDGGEKWVKQETQTKKTLFKVVSLDAKNLVACGQGGTVLRTVDGGKRWNKVETPLNIALMDMSFEDTQVGCAVGDRSGVLRTGDGGVTWEKGIILKDPLADNSDESEDDFNPLLEDGDDTEKEFVIYGVSLADRNIGYAAGEFGIFLKTTNGGKTWTKITVEEAEGKSIFGVFAQSPKRVWVVGIDGMMLLSEDGGESWKRIDSSVTKHLFAVKFKGRLGYAIGKEGIYLKSNDNGDTWELINIGAKFYLQDIELIKDAGWIVGAHGWLYETRNGGKSFNVVRSSPSGVIPLALGRLF
ncbi:MAG: hypothetical protein JRH15_09275 [Deltaproteobacteria bacterium]|nr:hypothetical protein [Deltaproteobacteria bacterium]